VRIGYLEQEPQLDEAKTVLENVLDGVREKTAVLNRFDEVSRLLAAEPAVCPIFSVARRSAVPAACFPSMSDWSGRLRVQNATLQEEKKALEEQIERGRLLDLRRRIDRAMDALRCALFAGITTAA
jgi:energy-dependent translational throttle protein EttA